MPIPTDSPRECPLPLRFYERAHAMSRSTLWRYRKAGLKAVRVAGKVFIKEADFVDFMARMGDPRAVCKAGKEVTQ